MISTLTTCVCSEYDYRVGPLSIKDVQYSSMTRYPFSLDLRGTLADVRLQALLITKNQMVLSQIQLGC